MTAGGQGFRAENPLLRSFEARATYGLSERRVPWRSIPKGTPCNHSGPLCLAVEGTARRGVWSYVMVGELPVTDHCAVDLPPGVVPISMLVQQVLNGLLMRAKRSGASLSSEARLG